jgi:DNA repair protein RecO (recombination protein O)
MINIDGLVIGERSVGETGKSITLLTKEFNCISVYVRGGQKSKKSNSSTQLFCYAKFSIESKRDASGGDRYYYNSSEIQKIFYNIRLDPKKTALACYFADLLNIVTSGSDNGDEVMRLTLNVFHFLNEGSRPNEQLKSIFEFRLMCEIGYRPYLIGCHKCLKPEADVMYFNIAKGVFECGDCVDNAQIPTMIKLDSKLFYIVQFIALVDYDRLFNFKISEAYQRKLTEFTERFCVHCCGYAPKTLKFYKYFEDA